MHVGVNGHQALRLLHVVSSGRVGGVGSVVQALSIGFHRLGHDVQVATVAWPEEAHEFEGPLVDAGVPLHRIDVGHRAYVQEHAAVKRLCEALSPDVVHTHGYRADVVAGRAARRAGFPTMTTVHGFVGGDWKNRLYERIQRMTFRNFDAVVAVSRALTAELRRDGVGQARIHLVPNAWAETCPPLNRAPARRALGQDLHGAVLGWVGRLSYEKGADVAIEALAHLRDLPVTLAMVGDGPCRRALEQRAATLGVASRIRWCGVLPQAGRLFAAFDVFLLSSRMEGTPIVLFEAMAARTPIVATSVGGVPDVLPQGAGWLVEPENPAALAAAVREILAHPRQAAARATAARTRLLTRYDTQRWLEAYDAIYRRLRRATPLPEASHSIG